MQGGQEGRAAMAGRRQRRAGVLRRDRAAVGDDPSLADADHPVGTGGDVRVMGDEDHGMALSLPPDMPVALEIPMMRMQETVPPAQRARMAIAATLALLGKEGSR